MLHNTLKIETFFSDFTESAFDVFSVTADKRLSRRNCAVIVNLQISDKYWIIYSHSCSFLSVIDYPPSFEFNCQNELIKIWLTFSMSSFVIYIISSMLKFFLSCSFTLSQTLWQLILSQTTLTDMSIICRGSLLLLSSLFAADNVVVEVVNRFVIAACEFIMIWSDQLIFTDSLFSLYMLHESLRLCSVSLFS